MSIPFFAQMHRTGRDWIVPWLVAALLGAAGACSEGPFACEDSDRCVDGDVQGVCEATGFCSFPDATCTSGQRYGDLAEDGLAGECVDGEVASTGVDPTTASTSASSTTEATTDSTDTEPGGDAYGPCTTSADCLDGTAVCVTNGNNRMCAPSCVTPVTPSLECPPPVDDAAEVGCLFTDAEQTIVRCFAVCDEQSDCPIGMTCVSPVCTWANE